MCNYNLQLKISRNTFRSPFFFCKWWRENRKSVRPNFAASAYLPDKQAIFGSGIFTVVCLFWWFSVFGTSSFSSLLHPPLSPSRQLALLTEGCPSDRLSLPSHSLGLRENQAERSTRQDEEGNRGKTERREGWGIYWHPHLTAPKGCTVHTERTAYKEKNGFNALYSLPFSSQKSEP